MNMMERLAATLNGCTTTTNAVRAETKAAMRCVNCGQNFTVTDMVRAEFGTVDGMGFEGLAHQNRAKCGA